MNSELFNEILLYAHLDSSGIDSDDLNTNPNTLENEINSVEKTLNIEELKKITTALNIDNRCNICSIIQ